MKRLLGIRAHTDGTYRSETLMGREYTVVPVVALVEGVLRGMASDGPELALADEFGLFPAGWNGRPLVMDHPVNSEGTPVSANSPEVLADYQIGFIFNAHMVDNKKLVLEAWVEKKRAGELNVNSKSVMEALDKGEMIEVSTGYFAQIEETPGAYEGESYDGVQRNIVPDHLAFLSLGSIGACSNADGCGAPRINSQAIKANTIAFRVNCEECGGTCPDAKGPSVMTQPAPKAPTANLDTKPAPSLASVIGDPVGLEKTVDQSKDDAAKPGQLSTNDQYATVEDYTYLAIEGGKMVRKKKKSGAYKARAHALIEQFDDTQAEDFASRMLAMREVIANSMPDGMMDYDAETFVARALREGGMYAYVIGLTNNMVIYEAYDPENYYYKTFQRTYAVDKDGKVTLGDDVQEVVLTTSIVTVGDASVSANSADPAGNKETKMADTPTPAETPQVHTIVNEQGTLEVQMDADGKPSTFKLTPKTNATQEAPKAQTFEQLLANAAPEIRETMESSLKLHNERKGHIIKALKDSGRCNFSDDALKAMKMSDLENLAALASVPTYVGQALPTIVSNSENTEGAPSAPLVFEVKKPQAAA